MRGILTQRPRPGVDADCTPRYPAANGGAESGRAESGRADSEGADSEGADSESAEIGRPDVDRADVDRADVAPRLPGGQLELVEVEGVEGGVVGHDGHELPLEQLVRRR
jgi:hypothetical protein